MRTLQYHTQRSPRDSHRSLTGGKKPNAISGTGESGWQILKRALAASDPHSSADFFRAIHYPLRPSNMPTLGPSILFAAGLTIGVGAGVLFPRKNSPEKAVMLPPPPPEGNYRGTVSTVATPTGGVSLQGGFPGKLKPDDESSALTPGPIPDVIKRTAYTAAYDRQKRHPAWVRRLPLPAARADRRPPSTSRRRPWPALLRLRLKMPTPCRSRSPAQATSLPPRRLTRSTGRNRSSRRTTRCRRCSARS